MAFVNNRSIRRSLLTGKGSVNHISAVFAQQRGLPGMLALWGTILLFLSLAMEVECLALDQGGKKTEAGGGRRERFTPQPVS